MKKLAPKFQAILDKAQDSIRGEVIEVLCYEARDHYETDSICVTSEIREDKRRVDNFDADGYPMRGGYNEIKCCNQWMYCGGFTNTCEKCGKDYNWNGSLLASRSFWGEETGESLSDILSINASDPEDLLEGE